MQTKILTSIALALLLVVGGPAAADKKDPHAEHRAMMHHKTPEPSAELFSDIDLRNALLFNQDGEEVRFVDWIGILELLTLLAILVDLLGRRGAHRRDQLHTIVFLGSPSAIDEDQLPALVRVVP